MSQMNIFDNMDSSNESNVNIRPGLNTIPDGELLFYPDFFDKIESELFFDSLRQNVVWKQEAMKMYSKQINFPRLTAWYGDSNKPYRFSGITLQTVEWNDALLEVRSKIEPSCNVIFNSVLLNLYRDGNDSISWHTDAEKELGQDPVIASVNFGARRTFQLRHIISKQKIEFDLTNGSLLIMRGKTQHFWQHQVPKTNKAVKERINLTFRVLK